MHPDNVYSVILMTRRDDEPNADLMPLVLTLLSPYELDNTTLYFVGLFVRDVLEEKGVYVNGFRVVCGDYSAR